MCVCLCVCVCIPSVLSLPPILPSAHPSRSSRSTRLSSLLHSSFLPALCLHMAVCICQCYFLSSSHPLLPPLCPQAHSLYLPEIFLHDSLFRFSSNTLTWGMNLKVPAWKVPELNLAYRPRPGRHPTAAVLGQVRQRAGPQSWARTPRRRTRNPSPQCLPRGLTHILLGQCLRCFQALCRWLYGP